MIAGLGPFAAFFGRLIMKFLLWRAKRQGLQIADDCNLVGFPVFGSEPYLISIGKHVQITGKVTFLTHDGATWGFRDLPEFKDVIKYGRITVHDNCFIGIGSTILPGVEIGPNSVVAAGSVVTKTVPPNSVAAGSPARVISTLEDYAAKCAAESPVYDKEAMKRDMKSELLKLFPYPW